MNYLDMRLFVAILLLGTTWAFPAHGEQNGLAEMLRMADSHSPMIRAAQERVKAAEAKIPQSLMLMDPMVGIKYYNIPAPGRDLGTANMIMYQYAQKIPFPLKIVSKRDAAGNRVDMEKENFRMTRLMVHADVKRLYFGLWSIDRRVRAMEDTLSVLERTERLTELRYRSGKTMFMDVLKIQVETAKLSAEVKAIRLKKKPLLLEMEQALGKGSEPGKVGDAVFKDLPLEGEDVDQMISKAMNFRPELKMREAELREMRSEYRLSVLDWFPDLTLMVEPYYMAGSFIQQDVSFSISLPIWGLTNQRPMNQEMYAKVLEAEAMLLHTRNKTKTEVAQAYERAAGAEFRLQALRDEAVPKSRAALRVAERAYQAGSISFIDLLDTVRMVLMQEMDYAMAVENLGMNLGHLETLIGQEIYLGGDRP